MPDVRDQRRMYGDLAWAWPIISPPEDYVGEARRATKVIRKHSGIAAKTLLHLGCGGGHLDLTLKREFRVTGVDLSEAMLNLARGLNPEVEYVGGDMRSVRLGRTFDAVAAFDSISYMLTPEDLRAAFETAFVHLRPGGVFLTYAEDTVERFRQDRLRTSVHSKGDVTIVFVEVAHDPDPTDTTIENTFVYLIRRRGRLEIETDRHLAGLFPSHAWTDELRRAGLEVRVEETGPEEDMPWFVGIKPC